MKTAEEPRAGATAASLFDFILLGRHQIAAAIATAADFATMIALVELLGAPPPTATLVSAAVGGVTNFTLGRTWAFRARTRGSIGEQSIRYAVVCAGGALLNASLLGVLLAVVFEPLEAGSRVYVVLRVIVSVLISVAYTYPLHTKFVFRVTGTEDETAA